MAAALTTYTVVAKMDRPACEEGGKAWQGTSTLAGIMWVSLSLSLSLFPTYTHTNRHRHIYTHTHTHAHTHTHTRTHAHTHAHARIAFEDISWKIWYRDLGTRKVGTGSFGNHVQQDGGDSVQRSHYGSSSPNPMPLLGVEPLQESYAFFVIDDGVMTRWFFYSGSFSMGEFAKKVGDLSANRESILINASGPCWRTDPHPGKGIPSKHVEQLLGKISYTCANCHIMAPTKVCDKCKFARYCSKECQRDHWSAHKEECESITSVYNRMEKRDGESRHRRVAKLIDPNTNRRAEPPRAHIYYGLTNRYDFHLMQFILSKHVMLPCDSGLWCFRIE